MAAGPAADRDATRWGIIASGQGGCRIASQLFTRTDNPGIDDRIVLINTNDTDIKESLDRVDSQLAVDREEINRNNVGLFGPADGTGNDFFDGERFAEEGFDEIYQPINNTARSDALMYTVALGGGTGNGSAPYIIDQFRQAPEGGAIAGSSSEAAWLSDIPQFVLAAWPFRGELDQRYFNAVCGLSRLLMREDGSPNADMALLASNARLKQLAEENDDAEEVAGAEAVREEDLVNRRIISALDLFISAGRTASDTLDVKDYARQPQQSRGAYHGTFGTALNKPLGLGLEVAIEKAIENTFVPMDPSTAEAAYVVVRAPQRKVNAGKITGGDVRGAFADWREKQDLRGVVGMHTLSKEPGGGNTFDVLVFLAGFDLTPLMEESRSWERYESERDRRERNSAGDRGKRIRQLEENLRQYRNNLEG
jgi:cell division GTPase FtsZ